MAYKLYETDQAEYVQVYANFAQGQIKHVDCLEMDELKNLDAIVLEMMVEPKAENFETADMPLKGSPGRRSPYELITNRIQKLAEEEGIEIPVFVGDREIGVNERMIYGMAGQLVQVALMIGMQRGISKEVTYALMGVLALKLVPSLSKWYLGNKNGETKSLLDNAIALNNILPAMPTGELRYAMISAKVEEYLVPEVLIPRLKAKGENRKPRVGIVYSPSAASIRHNIMNEKRRNWTLTPYRALKFLGMYLPSLDAMVELNWSLTKGEDGKREWDWIATDHDTGVVVKKDFDPADIEIPTEEELAEGFEVPEVTSTPEPNPMQGPEMGP